MKKPKPVEWLLQIDGKPNQVVSQLPPGWDALGQDFVLDPADDINSAQRIGCARLHVTACDGACRPRYFSTFAAALEAARQEFAAGCGVSTDGIRRFDGITVRAAGGRTWHEVPVRFHE